MVNAHMTWQHPELETTGGREEVGPAKRRWFGSTVNTDLGIVYLWAALACLGSRLGLPCFLVCC